MGSPDSRSSLPPPPEADVGALLRHWRTVRRLSQLELSLDAGVSARHLSYVETGRSQPSRDMVLRLADALEIPLRERNALLVAAGHAPKYFETGLAAPELAQVRSAVELILRHQEPYPGLRADDAAADDDLPEGRGRAAVLLDLHDVRHAPRRGARRAAHRVLLPGGRSDGQGVPRALRLVTVLGTRRPR
jgi:transcriptional regulator with XRE-family HTH domain